MVASLDWQIIQCPKCHGTLELRDDIAVCQAEQCRATFPSTEGVPILVREDNSIFDTDQFLKKEDTFFRSIPKWREWISHRIPDVSLNVNADRTANKLLQLLKTRPGKSRVLVVGGGIVGAGLGHALNDLDIEWVETDVAWGPQTKIICDAHDLPFRDGSFDAVIVQAVLEHVVDPLRCVEEIYRVLNDDGVVYADTPFIQQVHGRQYDFTRFTRLGHRRLFRHFEEIDSGISCGPGVALAWSLRYFLLSFFSSNRMRGIVSFASRISFFWLKYFDYYLAKKKQAMDAASAFFFLGRKSPSILSDRELLSDYQGGF
ncbi:methyltransferase domain-containing protein [Bremerella sp. T1]|uniref:methyltransferase domain-containing protein n=1 Tax=Bremerella sp. TYQ1 TaxID=3119568 RepID=UPI001CCFD4D2|nr:methyltransferase domain-containing protein [Bremerella volcania]UBM37493.1 class I SAM-dependent methyltransferase [Bremerella volcania]